MHMNPHGLHLMLKKASKYPPKTQPVSLKSVTAQIRKGQHSVGEAPAHTAFPGHARASEEPEPGAPRRATGSNSAVINSDPTWPHTVVGLVEQFSIKSTQTKS